MTRYRKRLITIEAVQLRWVTWNEVCEFVGSEVINPDNPAWHISAEEASDTCGEAGPEYIAFKVKTMHGEEAIIRHGDWIIPDAKPNTFYPCNPEVFKNTYEVLEE